MRRKAEPLQTRQKSVSQRDDSTHLDHVGAELTDHDDSWKNW